MRGMSSWDTAHDDFKLGKVLGLLNPDGSVNKPAVGERARHWFSTRQAQKSYISYFMFFKKDYDETTERLLGRR